MGREVHDHADVAHAIGERADALGGDEEDLAELALLRAPAQLEQRGVEALDVSHRGVDARRAADVDERAAFGRRGGQRLLDEDVDALGGEAAHGGDVLLGGHRDDGEVGRPGAQQARRGRRTAAPRRARRRSGRRAGSTAPAKATRGEAWSSRAWWRPIIPSPSTAPRSGLVESGLGTASLGYPPCPITPPPVSFSAPRPPSAATSASAPTSSSTTASSSATASSSRTTPCSASRRAWRRPPARRAPSSTPSSSRRVLRCAPGRSSSPARTSARGRSSAISPSCASAAASGPTASSGAARPSTTTSSSARASRSRPTST